jgi:hypothetical protein
MSKPTPLTVFDRRSGRTFQEFMDDSLATYESHPRRAPNQWLEAHPLYDWFVALWQNTSWSARKIEPFVRKHKIDMSVFEPGPFKSYADFFDRHFLPGKRRFPEDPYRMGAFGEARYFSWERQWIAMRIARIPVVKFDHHGNDVAACMQPGVGEISDLNISQRPRPLEVMLQGRKRLASPVL